MNALLRLRSPGLAFPGVAEKEVIAMLPTPYDLVYRWTAFVPLEDLLKICEGAMSMTHEDEDLFGNVTMDWERLVPFDVRVPSALVRDTWEHRSRHRRKRIEWPLMNNRAFITADEEDITEAMFRDEVEKAISVLLRYRPE